MDNRTRSQSPRRRDDGDRYRPKKSGGFRWKEKRRDDDARGDDRKLDRGYRDRGDRGDRPRSPRRDRDGDRYRDGDRDRDRDRRRDDREAPREDREKKKEKKEKKEKKPVMPQSSEPMIVVHVNDRLGTKAAIPCLASDPIKLFKAQVAARIGREPHEILLKRQGERPFKDQLTLEDYGVSNGVQLDLEVGTGD
ncbi:hypothetical protein N7448_006755 [Penicillium atrosanguineum]|uniref:Ubiquitin-like modifier HUB1 n=1 Tax=Penicillium atrosanguineum TaxID=1132637 RepID=A0A9W9PSJ8_9EURO|nr:uncharacterized protein N7443_010516 [Penicillium atrosanguineum]KAJ5132597.1 hypothetical protein N7448_006755 [Penicillium atrosanguineum]KAJ5141520.1 hypothetical protein N7526_002515 [Penicillium atrosanguineum]KAJ5290263.1 hypothetical protein N7443_010516 [Penicillium atrosanguineum]KAJ5308086.1 hypothetical protein N7476_008742 [Penicillium atrosanguineum]